MKVRIVVAPRCVWYATGMDSRTHPELAARFANADYAEEAVDIIAEAIRHGVNLYSREHGERYFRVNSYLSIDCEVSS